MSKKTVFALNKISNRVAKIDPDLLDHPVLGKNLIQVDDPDACIACNQQPESVTTVEGTEISLKESPEVTEVQSDPEELGFGLESSRKAEPSRKARTKTEGEK